MSELWYYRVLGEEFGPVSETTLNELIADGTIGSSDQVRRSRDAQWQAAGELEAGPAGSDAGEAAGAHDLDLLLSGPAATTPRPQGGTDASPDLEAMLSSEAPRRRRAQSTQWSYRIGGQRFGPFDFDTLFEHASAGKFSRYDEIRPPGSDEWVEAQTIVGLFPDEEVDIGSLLAHEPRRPAAAPKPAPKKKQWYYRVLNHVLGPVDFEGLFDLVVEGNLRPDDEIQEEGQTAWQRADSLVGLFPDDLNVDAATAAAVVEEPVEDSEDADWYFKMDDQQLGPVTFDRLMQLAQSGRLQRSDPIRLTKLGNWMEAGSMVGLFPEEAPPEKPAAPKKAAAAAAPQRPSGDADDWAAAVLSEEEPEPPPRRSALEPAYAQQQSSSAPADREPAAAPASAAALSIATKMAASAPAQRASFTPPPKSRSKSSSGGGISLPPGLGQTLMNPKVLGALGAVAVAAALFFVPWGSIFGPGSEDLTADLESLWGQIKPLHENKAPDAEWANIAGTVSPKLAEIAQEATSRGAGPSQPELQMVLMLASSSMPKVLESKSATKDTQIKVIDNTLSRLKTPQ